MTCPEHGTPSLIPYIDKLQRENAEALSFSSTMKGATMNSATSLDPLRDALLNHPERPVRFFYPSHRDEPRPDCDEDLLPALIQDVELRGGEIHVVLMHDTRWGG